ncbi:VOC family protein [Clostridium polynesiense]|uniref:VOC family protein n=1 Tax=Clostridium polynesiense TaxID=1325933 RepID=UPI00058BDDF0|nr:VOC family protein [Clostridium polynesiense]
MSISKDNIIFIIYVINQEKSRLFYEKLLGYKPVLDVPGMTEFQLFDSVKLGIMPTEGIMKILENKIPDPSQAKGIPRSEIYMFVDNPEDYYARLVSAGGKGISKCELRNWGDYAAYGSDLDGNIIAFAKKASE